MGNATQRTRYGPPGRSHLSRVKGLSAMTVRDGHHHRTQSLSRVDNGNAWTSGVANRVVRGVCEQALQPLAHWEGRAGIVMVANRTRESRLWSSQLSCVSYGVKVHCRQLPGSDG